jgi:hypothetical protein
MSMRWTVAFAFATSACGMVAGLGDNYAGPARRGADAAAPGDAAPDDGASDDGGASDAAAEAVADAGGRPSFCDYAEYFAFEDTLAGISGTAPTNTAAPQAYDSPGKYGKCAKLGKAGDVTSLKYNEPSRYQNGQGTVAFWFMPDEWTKDVTTTARVLYGSGSVGPQGTWEGPNSYVVAAPPSGQAGVITPLKDSDWNHFAATYRAGATSAVQIAVNGVQADGSGIYTPGGTMPFVLGDDTFPADACFDEVAIWTRVLSASEIQAIYRLTVPLVDACLTTDR